MDNVKIAGELVRIARSLVAADPKISVTKTVRLHVAAKDETSRVNDAVASVLSKLPSKINV